MGRASRGPHALPSPLSLPLHAPPLPLLAAAAPPPQPISLLAPHLHCLLRRTLDLRRNRSRTEGESLHDLGDPHAMPPSSIAAVVKIQNRGRHRQPQWTKEHAPPPGLSLIIGERTCPFSSSIYMHLGKRCPQLNQALFFDGKLIKLH